MQVLIEIDEKFYQWVKMSGILPCIAQGKVIPDNATNGDVIKALFGGMQINDPENENDLVYIEHLYFGFPKYWWDAPYKGGE